MYGPELADVYEMIFHGRGKDWRAEAADITRLVRSRMPDAASLLDVGCGTGAHLDTFRRQFGHVEGLEVAEPMRQVAVRRLPGVTVHAGDMRDFRLGRRFDAVVSLFSAIGYMRSTDELNAAVANMVGHLVDGGTLVIEPWWTPERFIEGYVAADVARENGRAVVRVSHSVRQGGATRMEARYLVAQASGLSSFTEIDVLTLFTREEYLKALEVAGCDAEFLPGGPTGRGLLLGARR